MSNENRSNIQNWRTKLDELDSLPGESLPDKSISWEKLHARLRGKKRDKRKAWYWAAACLLLTLIMITWKYSGTTKNNISQQNITHSKVECLSRKEKFILKKDTNKMISSNSEEKKLTSKIELRNKNIKKNFDQKEASFQSANTNSVNEIISPEPISNPNNPITVTILNAPPSMRKLKVIHLNELGDPVEASPDLANKRDLHSFQFKLAAQEVYTNSPVAFNKTGFTILKTKSSPSN
ncbi:MAG: hypothetical protein M3Z26_02345 [Bacteroidota bacterium]|nr:hypothetical protein [Bacteroidota bacterium]